MYHRVKVGSYPTVAWTVGPGLNPDWRRQRLGCLRKFPPLEALVRSSTKKFGPVNLRLPHPAAGKEPGVKGLIA